MSNKSHPKSKFQKYFIAAAIFVVFAVSAQIAFKSYAEFAKPLVAPGDWPSFNRTLDSQRFSPLTEINTTNVEKLKPQCTYDLGQKVSFQNGPIVVDGIMYITTENDTMAVNAASCEEIWKYHREFTTDPNSLHVNRGVAFANNRVYRGSNDGYLIALEAKDGTLAWETKIAEATLGESIPAAPVVWNNMVFIGQAGGDNVGVRGRMMAFQASDGKAIWSFDLAPLKGPGSETWPESTAKVPRTGAATWTSYSIDEASGTVLVPTGNAAPDFIKSVRPGLNLYSDSVVILDARSGALQSYYQVTKDDFHDWDVAAAPVLYRHSRTGHRWLAEAGKDGLLHFVDLDTKSIVFSKETTTRLNTDVPITEDGTRFCPGTQGGSEWNGAAYHPSLNTLFVPAVDWCTTVKLAKEGLPEVAKSGDPFTGAVASAPFGTMDPKSRWKGYLTAFNAENGSVRWKFESATPLLAGVTPTAGGLVFMGDLNGNFLALNAETGKILFQSLIGEPLGGGIISYEVEGKQKIAVAAGMQSKIWQTQTSSSRIVVYGLE